MNTKKKICWIFCNNWKYIREINRELKSAERQQKKTLNEIQLSTEQGKGHIVITGLAKDMVHGKDFEANLIALKAALRTLSLAMDNIACNGFKLMYSCYQMFHAKGAFLGLDMIRCKLYK